MKKQSADFPELKLPPEGFRLIDSLTAELVEGTFANELYSAIRLYEKNFDLKVSYPESASEARILEAACSNFNENYDNLRTSLDQHMQSYILEHGGNIDSWGNSGGTIALSYPDKPNTHAKFDYFGADYQVEGYGADAKIVRKSTQLTYRNCYKYRDTKEFAAAEKERKSLEDKLKKLPKPEGFILPLLCLLGSLYLLSGILMIAADWLFHISNALDQFVSAHNNWFILVLPYILYALIIEIFSEISGSMSIFLLALLIGSYLFGIFFLFILWADNYKKARARRAVKKDLNKLVKSRRYKELREENEWLRKRNEEMAEKWHRAWFSWICTLKSEPDEVR